MKTIYRLLFYLTLISIVRAEEPAESASAPRDRVSLREVTDAVLANNPAIQQSLNKWNAAKLRVRQELAWDDLKVTGNSRAARFIDIAPNSFADQIVSVEQLVPVTGKNLLRGRIAAAAAVEAFEDARREQLNVLTKTRTSYFHSLSAYAQLDLNRKNLTSLRQNAEVSRSRYEVGRANLADALASEVEVSKSLEAEQEILRSISSAQSQLNVLMNRDAFAPLGRPQNVTIVSQVPELSEIRALMATNRPEIKTAQAKIDVQKAQLELARRNWIPDPAVMVQAQRYNDSRQAASEVGVGVSFTLPWVNPGKYSAGVREAKENLSAAERAFDLTNSESLGLLSDALRTIQTAEHHVDLYRDKLLPQARQAFEANQFAYESNKIGFLEWIISQRILRDAEATATQHLSDYESALAELESIVGADLKLFPSARNQIEESK